MQRRSSRWAVFGVQCLVVLAVLVVGPMARAEGKPRSDGLLPDLRTVIPNISGS